jgi:hypothetical protein
MLHQHPEDIYDLAVDLGAFAQLAVLGAEGGKSRGTELAVFSRSWIGPPRNRTRQRALSALVMWIVLRARGPGAQSRRAEAGEEKIRETFERFHTSHSD